MLNVHLGFDEGLAVAGVDKSDLQQLRPCECEDRDASRQDMVARLALDGILYMPCTADLGNSSKAAAVNSILNRLYSSRAEGAASSPERNVRTDISKTV